MANAQTSAVADRLSATLKGPDGPHRAAAIKEIAKAIDRSGGVLTHAADRLGIGHRTIRRWVKQYPELESEVRKIREARGVPHYVGDPARQQDKPSRRRSRKA